MINILDLMYYIFLLLIHVLNIENNITFNISITLFSVENIAIKEFTLLNFTLIAMTIEILIYAYIHLSKIKK